MNGLDELERSRENPPRVSPLLRLRVTSCVSLCTYVSLESSLDSASFFFFWVLMRTYDLLADILMPVMFFFPGRVQLTGM